MRHFLVFLSFLAGFAINTVAAPPARRVLELYPSGKVKVSGHTIDGQKHGQWRFYTEKGHLTHKEKWKKGTLQWQVFYYENGRISRIIDKKGQVKDRPECGC